MNGSKDQFSLNLLEVVRRIVEVAHPEMVVLFGSAARGEAGPDSDVDLLVVVRPGVHRRRLAGDLYVRMIGVGVAVDLMVVTTDDVKRFKDSSSLVIGTALEEGQILYAA